MFAVRLTIQLKYATLYSNPPNTTVGQGAHGESTTTPGSGDRHDPAGIAGSAELGKAQNLQDTVFDLETTERRLRRRVEELQRKEEDLEERLRQSRQHAVSSSMSSGCSTTQRWTTFNTGVLYKFIDIETSIKYSDKK